MSLRPFASEPSLARTTSPKTETLFAAASEPSLNDLRRSTTVDDSPLSCTEIFHASHLLEDIVSDVSIVKSLARKASGQTVLNDRILRIVYDTMKYLPFVDTILIKTRFLVYHPEFLNRLALLKIILCDFMKSHFDLEEYPGIVYEENNPLPVPQKEFQDTFEIIEDCQEALLAFHVKLGAALARIRIDKRASGTTLQEMITNILPQEVRSKEALAGDMRKFLRIRDHSSKQVFTELIRQISARQDEFEFDEQFEDLIGVSPRIYQILQETDLMKQHHFILQDKSFFYIQRCIEDHVEDKKATELVFVNPGCGTLLLHVLDQLPSIKVHCFESRKSKLDILKTKLVQLKLLHRVNFMTKDVSEIQKSDETLKNAPIVIFTPVHSGSAIVDKLSYFMQEKDYPLEDMSVNEKNQFKLQNRAIVHNCMAWDQTEVIIYATHSIYPEENQLVIQEVMSTYAQDKWDQDCVLPEFPLQQTESDDHQEEEHFQVKPSSIENGVFIAAIKKKIEPETEPEEMFEEEEATEEIIETVDDEGRLVRKRKPKKHASETTLVEEKEGRKGRKKGIKWAKLPKAKKTVIDRLSQPKRTFTHEDLQKREQERLQKQATLLHSAFSDMSLKVDSSSSLVDLAGGNMSKKQLKLASIMQMARRRFALKSFYSPRFLAVRDGRRRQRRENKIWHPQPWK